MKIEEIYQNEQENDNIILYKEGIFWRAYEVSAYLFKHYIKEYDIKVRFYKCIKQDIVYMGFPVSYIDSIVELCRTKGCGIRKTDEYMLKIDCTEDISEFMDWKQKIVGETTSKESNTNTNDLLIKLIQEFDLANSTPMQGLTFIQELKNELKGKSFES